MKSIGEALALVIIGIPGFFLLVGAMTWVWQTFGGWYILFWSPLFIMLLTWFFQGRKEKKRFYS